MKPSFKTALRKALTGGKGVIIKGVVSALTGVAALLVTKYQLPVPDGWEIQFAVGAGALVGWAIEAWAAGLNTEGVKQIQDELAKVDPKIVTDGVAAKVTITATANAVEDSQTPITKSQFP